MSKFQTGDRVYWEAKHTQTGTIIDLAKLVQLRPGRVVVCTDEDGWTHYSSTNEDLARYTGRGHSFLAKREELGHCNPGNDYTTIPAHIAVMVAQDFQYDGMSFGSGTIGRAISSGDPETDYMLISWKTKRNNNFYDHYVDNKLYSHCYAVPTKDLTWCRLSLRAGVPCRPKEIWPGKLLGGPSPTVEVGQFVIYNAKSGLMANDDFRTGRISPGTILKILAVSNHYSAEAVGACHPGALGLKLKVRFNQVTPFPFNYILEGTSVEISADLTFRKRNLKNKTGIVVLPTDADGDVGIEFQDDIGAGSLDGHGRAGCCLYVPSEILKDIS